MFMVTRPPGRRWRSALGSTVARLMESPHPDVTDGPSSGLSHHSIGSPCGTLFVAPRAVSALVRSNLREIYCIGVTMGPAFTEPTRYNKP